MVLPDQRLDLATRSSPAPSRWHWIEALATARPGNRYRLSSIASSVARHRCRELGCSEGEIVTCTTNAGGFLGLRVSDGRQLVLERKLAWFVQAEVVS